MKTLSVIFALGLATPAAFAVKLTNKDSSSHDITIKCSTTTQTSLSGNTTRDIGNGPCTVTVKKTNSSATASGNSTLVIKDGKVSAGN